MPAGIPWYYWRIVFSDRLKVTLSEVKNSWSIDELLDAHELLDAYENAEREASLRKK